MFEEFLLFFINCFWIFSVEKQFSSALNKDRAVDFLMTIFEIFEAKEEPCPYELPSIRCLMNLGATRRLQGKQCSEANREFLESLRKNEEAKNLEEILNLGRSRKSHVEKVLIFSYIIEANDKITSHQATEEMRKLKQTLDGQKLTSLIVKDCKLQEATLSELENSFNKSENFILDFEELSKRYILRNKEIDSKKPSATGKGAFVQSVPQTFASAWEEMKAIDR